MCRPSHLVHTCRASQSAQQQPCRHLQMASPLLNPCQSRLRHRLPTCRPSFAMGAMLLQFVLCIPGLSSQCNRVELPVLVQQNGSLLVQNSTRSGGSGPGHRGLGCFARLLGFRVSVAETEGSVSVGRQLHPCSHTRCGLQHFSHLDVAIGNVLCVQKRKHRYLMFCICENSACVVWLPNSCSAHLPPSFATDL